MRISPSFNKTTCKYLEKFATCSWVKPKYEKGFSQPVKYAAAMMVTSIVSKDLVGCVVYTTQSWNNKKIPESKRKFVAMTDLMNGIIMVGGQFLAGKVIEKQLGPKLIGKYFTGEKEIVNKAEGTISKKLIEGSKAPFAPNMVYGKYLDVVEKNKAELKKLGMNVDDAEAVQKIGKDVVSKCAKDGAKCKAIAGGFTIIVSALGTMALVKRTLAPLLSTPLAGYVKDKYVDKKPKNGAKVESKPEDKKADKKSEEKPNSDDLLLDHSMAPWNYTQGNNSDKKSFNKVASK